MDLKGQPAVDQPLRVAVLQLAHRYAVDRELHPAAIRDHRVVVPLPRLDHAEQSGRVAHGADNLSLALIVDQDLLAALRQHVAKQVLHDHAGPAARGVEVGLSPDERIAAGLAGPPLLGVVVDSRVAPFQPELEPQLEVFDLVFPNQEIVLLQLAGDRPAGNRPILDRPDRAVAVPAVQRLAVEQRDEAGLHPGDGLRSGDVAMNRPVRAGRDRGLQIAGRKLDCIQIELEHLRVRVNTGHVAERGVEDPPLPVRLDPSQGEIAVLAVDPASAHVGPRGVQRQEHAQLGAVVGRPVLVDLIGNPKILAAEGRDQRIAWLLHRYANLFGPRMPGERTAKDLFELGPLAVGGDGVMDADNAAAVLQKISEALAENHFDLLGIRA